MKTELLLAAAALSVVLYKVLTIGRRGKTLPPGPPTVPILGNAHLMPTKWAQLRLTEWSRKYGDIYSLMIGSGVITVISSYTAVKELLDKQSSITGDRPQTTIGDTVTGGVHMAQAHYDDPNWGLLRRAASSILTVQKCAEHIPIQRAESIQFMYDLLKDPHSFPNHAERYTYSVISSVIYGARFPRFESKEVADFYYVTGLWSRLMEPGRHPPVDLIPILKSVPERWALWKREAKKVRRLQRAHYYSMFNRAQNRMNKGESVGAFMENIIQDQKSLGMDQELMVYLGGVLLEGGSDTTASYFKTLRLALTAFPEVQRKAHDEMDRVVSNDRLPRLEDISKLPYIRAIIKEARRWRPPAPLGLPHAATEDAHYKGYTVPSGATIFLNVWGIAHNETLYERHDEFWPDRYLKTEFGTREDVDVSAFRHTLSFGSGKRICPGMHLANNSVEFNTMMLIWGFDFLKAIDPATKQPIEVDISNYSEGLFTAPNPFVSDIRPRSAHHASLIEHAFRDAAPTFERFETGLAPEDAQYVAEIRGAINQL